MIINNERIYFPRRFKQSNYLKRSTELHEHKVYLIVWLRLQKEALMKLNFFLKRCPSLKQISKFC